MATKLPMEVINNILSYRTRHPIATLISNLKDDLVCEAYQNWGGNYPDDPDDEEGEYIFDELIDETLYQIAQFADYFNKQRCASCYRNKALHKCVDALTDEDIYLCKKCYIRDKEFTEMMMA